MTAPHEIPGYPGSQRFAIFNGDREKPRAEGSGDHSWDAWENTPLGQGRICKTCGVVDNGYEQPCVAAQAATEPPRTAGSTAVADQPAPVDQGNPSAHDLVIADLAERKAFGLAKYGVTLQANNGRDTLQDLYEELLDALCYTRALIEERKRLEEKHDEFKDRMMQP